MTIVTASTRLARSLRREDDIARERAGDKVWEARDILPWSAWIARLWSEAIYEGKQQRLLLSDAQELVLWEQAVAASPESEDLLNLVGAAELASEARALIYNWHLPQDAAAFQGIPDAEAFRGWMRSFEASVKQRGFITAAELPGELARGSGNGFVSYVGFDDLTPAQRRLFDSYGALPLLQPSPGWEPQRKRIGIASAVEELLAAASWARAKLEANPAASIGVVIPDLAARRASVERTFFEVMGGEGAYHLSAPAPLSESPIVSAALLALRLSREKGLSTGDYGLILRSPYFLFTAQKGAAADLAMRRFAISRATLAHPEMASLFPRLAPAFAAAPKTQRASDWSRTFSQLVRASGWPGNREWNSTEYQAIESWKDLLGDFSGLDAVLGEIGFDDALRRLDLLAAETFFGPADEDEPVQVMGVLEAAGAQFDALWITGLEDRVWPPSARPNPFIPLALQRAAGSPGSSAEQQAAYAMRVTTRLLAAAPEVICSYPEREGEEMLRPSPLIAALPGIAYDRPDVLFETAQLEIVTGDAAPPLIGNTVQRGGMNVIADQSACPFRAFARHRLHARSLDVVEPGLTPRERGIVTHKVLELIWSELGTQKALLAMNAFELQELVRKSVRAALRSGLGMESRKMTQMQALEEKRLAGILNQWLDMEKERPGFEVIGQERSGQFRPGGLELNIKTDRVDRYTSDGKLAIIDYKTGVTETLRDWDGDRLKAPQVPLYCVAADQDVATAVFGRLAAGDIKFIGYSDREQAGAKVLGQEEFRERVAGWRQTLDKLGEEFIGGEARVQPALRTTCRLCDLQPLCRISSAEPDEDEASD